MAGRVPGRVPHLLHVAEPTTGGTAAVVVSLVRAALDAGYTVTVACPREGDLRAAAESLGCGWVELRVTRGLVASNLLALGALRREMRRADLVHLHSSKAGALGRVLGVTVRRRPPIVFTPHAWSWYVGGRAAGVYRRIERWAAGRCDVITVTSPEELDDGRRVLGDRVRLELIENGVDVDAYTPEGPVADRDDRPLLVCVGRLSHQKGQDRLIAALARSRHGDARLRLVGEGDTEPALRGLAATLGIEDRVDFVGHADPRPHLRAADVVVFPSRWEGMALALLEAMAVGAAIVSTDCQGSSALLGSGVLAHQTSDEAAVADEIATAVDGLLDNPAERRSLGLRAGQAARQKHALGTTTNRFRDVWGSLADRP